ncbi:family 2 encapsulin nanocompartment cargo protein terpene cyclase [Nocardia sp. alder85J]|uniref:family 2 encapsulin nanocompartment cargo protein terpene cyclase n=1 Tax=Nocardia sp. alder85J TaxID=2862949 RepID=UPI001CD25FB9|nr:family 2 encapsulin nanocompartment cargo protein terpene cyclase [Nocardia sp. alder85J]MCX4094396.1 family 2 encapsulin nanocompartment cargo protein terpene cyclase [Nocardia sp. alder85J]
MSVLSRAAAPPATDEVAAAIATLLSDLASAPPAILILPGDTEAVAPEAQPGPLAGMTAGSVPLRLLGPVGLGAAGLLDPLTGEHEPVAAPGLTATAPAPGPARGRIPSGPGGFGAAGLPLTRLAVAEPVAPPPAARSESDGASSIPPLYCPPPVRDDPVLAEAVNVGIVAWAEAIGLYEGRLDELREADFGRLIMLAHPDCDNADLLLAVAKCAVSEWSVDDYYCEEDADPHAPDGSMSTPEAELGPRLELAMATMDPAHLPAKYVDQLERALQADPILRAFRTSFDHLAHYATPAQSARLRTEIGGWFIALGAEAGWRTAGRMPPVWEYLTNRQPHSFLPCMAPIDVVGGYELGAAEYCDPRVRRVVTTAALAAQMVNDLYSMAREDLSGGREFNLPTVLAAEEQCSRSEAVRRTADVHDELMHRFEREAAVVAATATPELHRFLVGLWSWMGGNRAWHAHSRRYHDQ